MGSESFDLISVTLVTLVTLANPVQQESIDSDPIDLIQNQ